MTPMNGWPQLETGDDAQATLHRWTQIAGKIRMALTPLVNHWWNVPLYVSPRGLTTSTIPYGDRSFEIEFDFIAHQLQIRVSDGTERSIPLAPRSVADMYAAIFSALRELRIDVRIWHMPVEIENPVAFDRDEAHRSYDREWTERLHQTLLLVAAAFARFRGEFIGKCSPVHFFWGSFDLAVTRFSGRLAPPRPEADAMTREAYSHEVSSVGFWPGAANLPKPTFYSYAAPEPAGFRTSAISPATAYYNEALGGFYLDLADVRNAPDPEAALLAFCRTTYDAAATNAQWDRAALERRS
jgi:hypothetical protein